MTELRLSKLSWPSIFLFGFCVILPLLVGGVHIEVTAGSAIAVGIAAFAVKNKDWRFRVSTAPTLALILLPLGLSFIQLIPVPLVFQKYIAPSVYEAVKVGMQTLEVGDWSSMRPLSVMPAATLHRFLKGGILVGWSIFLYQRSRIRGLWGFFLNTVLAAASIELVVAAIHRYQKAEKILFWYTPEARWREGFTFISENHAAVFFGIAVISALAVAFDRRGKSLQNSVVGTVLSVLFTLVLFAIESYGTIAAIAFSLCVWLLLRYGARRKVDTKKRFVLVSFVIGVLVSISIATLAFGWWVEQCTQPCSLLVWGMNLAEVGGVRLHLIGGALSGIAEAPWLGIGSGATEDFIFRYLDWSRMHPAKAGTIEHEFAEGILQYGLIGSLVIGSGLLWWGWRLAKLYIVTGSTRMASVWAMIAFGVTTALFHFPLLPLGLSILLEGFIIIGTESTRIKYDYAYSSGGVSNGLSVTMMSGLVIVAAIGGYGTYQYVQYPEVSSRVNAANIDQRFWQKHLFLRPYAGRVFRDASLNYFHADQSKQSRQLADRAFEYQPHGRMALFRANIYWSSGRKKEALGLYRDVFSSRFEGPKLKWLREGLLQRVRSPRELAASVSKATDIVWQRVFHELKVNRGTSAALNFAHELNSRHPDRIHPYRLVFKGYMQRGQTDLALAWSDFVLERFSGATDKSSAGMSMKIKALNKKGDIETARALLVKAFNQQPDREIGESVLKFALRQSPQLELELVSRAFELVCPDTTTWDQLCFKSKARLLERRGKLDRAEGVYRRIAAKFGRKNLLIGFFRRHSRCLALQNLVSSWTEAGKLSKERGKRIVSQCHPHRK